MHKLTITIDGSKAPEEAIQEAMNVIGKIGGRGTQKIALNLNIIDDEAEDTQNHLTEVLSRLDSSLKITIKAETERVIIGRIPGVTPIDRAIANARTA